jgi:hypothetical protein
MIQSRHRSVATALFSILAFGAGFALAGAPLPGRINDDFFFENADVPSVGFAVIEIDGTEFEIEGSVSGVGTDGDDVTISFSTQAPTNLNADDKQGRVRQSRFSTLVFFIESTVEERDLALEISLEKCAIDGKVNVAKDEGQVTVECSGTNIYSEISASQEASIQAAFADTKRVKIKVSNDGSKGSLTIKLRGPLEELI